MLNSSGWQSTLRIRRRHHGQHQAQRDHEGLRARCRIRDACHCARPLPRPAERRRARVAWPRQARQGGNGGAASAKRCGLLLNATCTSRLTKRKRRDFAKRCASALCAKEGSRATASVHVNPFDDCRFPASTHETKTLRAALDYSPGGKTASISAITRRGSSSPESSGCSTIGRNRG